MGVSLSWVCFKISSKPSKTWYRPLKRNHTHAGLPDLTIKASLSKGISYHPKLTFVAYPLLEFWAFLGLYIIVSDQGVLSGKKPPSESGVDFIPTKQRRRIVSAGCLRPNRDHTRLSRVRSVDLQSTPGWDLLMSLHKSIKQNFTQDLKRGWA